MIRAVAASLPAFAPAWLDDEAFLQNALYFCWSAVAGVYAAFVASHHDWSRLLEIAPALALPCRGWYGARWAEGKPHRLYA